MVDKNFALRESCVTGINAIMLERRRMNGGSAEMSSESTDSDDERMLIDLIKSAKAPKLGHRNGAGNNTFDGHMNEKVKVWQKNALTKPEEGIQKMTESALGK